MLQWMQMTGNEKGTHFRFFKRFEIERKELSTIDFESAKADMGYKIENWKFSITSLCLRGIRKLDMHRLNKLKSKAVQK